MAYDYEISGPRFDQHLYSYVLFNPNQKRAVMMGISQTQRTSCFVKGSKW